VEICQHIA